MNYRALILTFLLPLAANAGLIADREFDHTLYDVDPDGLVEIDNISGEIVVHGTRDNNIRLKGTLGKNIEGVEVQQKGSSTLIRVVYPEGRNYKSGAAEIEVWIPRTSSLEVVGVSADVETKDVLGRQGLKSVSGQIRGDAFDSDVVAQSVSGDVYIEGHEGSMEHVALASVSGDVYGSGLAGEIDAESVSGDVEIVESRIVRGEFSSTSGDLDLEAELVDGAQLSFETVSGDVTIFINGRADGRYDLSTFSGDIDNCFGPELEEQRGRGQRHRFSEGNDSFSRIDANSLSGDIDVCNR